MRSKNGLGVDNIRKIDSALEYFKKKNYSPSGTLQKINAYQVAEKSIRDMDSIMYVFGKLQQDMISTDGACKKIAEIIRRS